MVATPTPSPVQRRALIAELISSQQVWSQQELSVMLRKRKAISVTQATLSRDLTELGVVKGPNGYMLPSALGQAAPVASASALSTALRQHFLSAARSGTMAVIRTPAGHANSLAVELDRAGMPGVLGTIAGDDTVFIAMRDADAATDLIRSLERLVRTGSLDRGATNRGNSAA